MVRKRLVPEVDLTYTYVSVNICEFKDADAFRIPANYAFVPPGRARMTTHLRPRERERNRDDLRRRRCEFATRQRNGHEIDGLQSVFSLVFLHSTCKSRSDLGKF